MNAVLQCFKDIWAWNGSYDKSGGDFLSHTIQHNFPNSNVVASESEEDM